MSFGGYKPDYVCMVDGLFNRTAIKYMNESYIQEQAEMGVNNETFLNTCDINGTSCDAFYFFGAKKTVIAEVR